MQRPLLLVALIGIVIIAGVSLAGYYLGKVAEERGQSQATPSPEATPSPAPSPSPSPSASPPPTRRSPFPTAPPARPTPIPSVSGMSTFRSALLATPAPAPLRPTPLRISFVSLPGEVHSRQPFTVEWRVDGPAGTSGTKTTLSVSYQTSSSKNGSSSSSSSSSEQSFGSFTIPRTFTTQLTYGGPRGTIHLTTSADVGGTIIQTNGSIQLVNEE